MAAPSPKLPPRRCWSSWGTGPGPGLWIRNCVALVGANERMILPVSLFEPQYAHGGLSIAVSIVHVCIYLWYRKETPLSKVTWKE